MDDVISELGSSLQGKTLVDVTNALTEDMQLASGCTTSGTEHLQQIARGARVVKAFNTQFAGHMDTGQLGGQPLTVFAASDDAQAKQQVMEMAKGIGFTPIDAGPCGMRDRSSLWATSIFQLGYVLGLGTNIGLQLVRS